MPHLDDLDPNLARALRNVIELDLPGFELIAVESRRTQPRPPEPAARTQQSVLVITPSVDALKTHYASLSGGAAERLPTPEWNEHRPTKPRPADTDLVYCRVKAKTAEGRRGAEISVLVSLRSGKIVAL